MSLKIISFYDILVQVYPLLFFSYRLNMVYLYDNNILINSTMSTIDKYTDSDYEGEFNLLRAEKQLIIKALIKSEGNIKKAKFFLSPTDKPIYGFVAHLSDQIRRHGINVSEIKQIIKIKKEFKPKSKEQEFKELNQVKIQEKLKAIEKKEGITLRSVLR